VSATIIQFQRPLYEPGVCRHCFARRRVVDYSKHIVGPLGGGVGKWCDGCMPVLLEMVQKVKEAVPVGVDPD
jgi:hypothetical protein